MRKTADLLLKSISRDEIKEKINVMVCFARIF